jgi:hypothetical protein
MTTASVSADATIGASAALIAPLPPRRPADLALAYREAPSTPEMIALASIDPPAELMPDHRTPASRLLFSGDLIRATPPQTDLVGDGSGARMLQRGLLVASADEPPMAQTFSQRTGDGAGGQGFVGPAVKALPTWRVAQGAF